MRYWRGALLVAAIAAVYGAIDSLVVARELGELAPRGRLEVSPLGALLNAVGLLLAVLAFGGLGLVVRRTGGTRRDAIQAGILAGALAGLTTGLFRSLAVRDYLGAVVSGYGVDAVLLDAILGIGVGFAALAGSGLGALLSWLGFAIRR